jgi:hypothetical protein
MAAKKLAISVTGFGVTASALGLQLVFEENDMDLGVPTDHSGNQLPKLEICVWKRIPNEHKPVCLHQFHSGILPDEFDLKIAKIFEEGGHY